MSKVAIVGSRSYNNYKEFKGLIGALQQAHKFSMDMIVSGGAQGVDEMAYRYAIEKGITFVCHPPRPEDGYPAKFFRRNLRIVEQSEIVIAFWVECSKGTGHSISLAKRLHKKLFVFEF